METTTTSICINGTSWNDTMMVCGINETSRRNMTGEEVNSWDDATWILTSAFVIFTMQSGFGLLESGMVSRKNEVNIMVKNAVDVIFGGLTYWMFGYGFSFGTGPGTNAFCGVGNFFTDSTDPEEMGWVFAKFVFQASFATTATTIVSGAMAERTKLEAYCVFSLVNTLVYCFPAHWIWSETGIFARMGCIDIAGASAVHLVGGTTGLVATLMLKPRRGRFEGKGEPEMSNPTNALLGMFMLWWGWLGFNCGSTFGISGGKWKLATRAAVNTLLSSSGGGLMGLGISWIFRPSGRKFDIGFLNNGVLGGLVGVTAICALSRPWEGFVIGAVGGCIAVSTPRLLEKLKIDDPVGIVGVHLLAAFWSLAAVGLFARPDEIENLTQETGLFYGGGFRLLGVQCLMAVTMFSWTLVTAAFLLVIISKTVGLRCSLKCEILGADISEHGINQLSKEEQNEITKELHSLGLDSPFDHPSSEVRLRSASSRRRSYNRNPSVATVTGVAKSVERGTRGETNGTNHSYLSPQTGGDQTELELAGSIWYNQQESDKSRNSDPLHDDLTLSINDSPKNQKKIEDRQLGNDNTAFEEFTSESRNASPSTVIKAAAPNDSTSVVV